MASLPILLHRLGTDVAITALPYGQEFKLGEVSLSFHSAGHILGSAQVRMAFRDEVWVMSGDYKRGADASCAPFELVPCDTFVSEATFALPIYHWQSGAHCAREIYEWWQSDRSRPSLLFCYALGKSQRVLAELAAFTHDQVYLHGAVASLTEIYRESGVVMLPTVRVSEAPPNYDFKGDLILAPPSAHRSPWMKRFKEPQTAFASGWMQVRGARRRRGYEKGFVLSDHADWNELRQTIRETGARRIFLTHGRSDALARVLREEGKEVRLFQTEYEDEEA
jgi:putative mRNA 3-end processing factor